MPVKRRIAKARAHRITPEAIEAWLKCDFHGLHNALDLKPWDRSPLPRSACAFGVCEETVAAAALKLDANTFDAFDESAHLAYELQQELVKVAGWPDCRAAFQENLRQDESYAAYLQHLVDNPSAGGTGTGTDPASRRAALKEWLERVAWRRQLLEDLDK